MIKTLLRDYTGESEGIGDRADDYTFHVLQGFHLILTLVPWGSIVLQCSVTYLRDPTDRG